MSLKCGDLINIINKIAPLSLQEKWDNSGLNIGDINSDINKILFALDVNDDVISEAIQNNVDIIVTHHPILFNEFKSITTANDIGKKIYKLIQNNISVYCAHTSFDVSNGGTNDILCNILELCDIEILSDTYYDDVFKIAVFVPNDYRQAVVESIKKSGAGCIGNYSDCIFYSSGYGEYKPLDNTNPYIGNKFELQKVDEVKIETVAFKSNVENVIRLIKEVHPYEEVAIDVIRMDIGRKNYGIGRVGNLKKEMKFIDFANFVKEKLYIDTMRISNDCENTPIKRVAICSGAGASFFLDAKIKNADVYITGDIKFHEYQKAKELGICLIDGTHYKTENIAMPVFASYVKKYVDDVEILISNVDGQTFKNI